MYIGKQYYPHEPLYQTLTREQQEQIHSSALRVLWEQGMSLTHPVARSLLAEKGAIIKNDIVYIPPSLVEWAVRQAPSRVTLYDRNGKPTMFLEHKNVYFGTGSDTTLLTDYESKTSQPWTLEQIAQAVRLCDYLENIDFVMSMGIISDVHYSLNTREQYATMIRNTTKPHVIVCDGKEDLEDVFRMYIAVRGGREELRHKPYGMVYNEPTSPLVHTDEAIDKLLLCADYGMPSNYATGSLSGATTPMTAAGTIVLSTAECLCGLVIHQLRNPGAPFVFGYGNSPMDMRTVQAAYAHPVGMQTQGGMCDMARYYGLPSWGEAGHGCSKLPDEQAAQEGMFTIQIAALQGCNVTHDVGYNNFGLGFCLETLVLNDNAISMVKELLKGVEITEETLAVEAIKKTGCNGDFLRSELTRKGARQMWRSELSDYLPYSDWQGQGSLSMSERAHRKVKDIIASHYPEALDPEIDAHIEDIIRRARMVIPS